MKNQQNGPLYYYVRLSNLDILKNVIIHKTILNNVHSESSKQETYLLEVSQWSQSQCGCFAPLEYPPCTYLFKWGSQVQSSAIPVVGASLVINFQTGSRGSSIVCKTPPFLLSWLQWEQQVPILSRNTYASRQKCLPGEALLIAYVVVLC